MKFVVPYEYPENIQYVNDNVRYLADSLNDGFHELAISTSTFNDITVNQSASISQATIGSLSAGTIVARTTFTAPTGGIGTFASNSSTIQTLIGINVTITSANITSAVIGSATVTRMSTTDQIIGSASITTGSTVGWYANLLRASSVRILEIPKATTVFPWQPDKFLQIASNFWCPVISATL